VPPPWLLAAQQAYKSSQTGAPRATPLSVTSEVAPLSGVVLHSNSKPDNWERFSPTGPGAGFSNPGQTLLAQNPVNQQVGLLGSSASGEVGPSPWVSFESDTNHGHLHRHVSMPESQLNNTWSAGTHTWNPPGRQASGPFAMQSAAPQGAVDSSFEQTVPPEPGAPLTRNSSGGKMRLRRRPMVYEIGKRPFQQRKRTRSLYGYLSEDLAVQREFGESSDVVQTGEMMLSPVYETAVSEMAASPPVEQPSFQGTAEQSGDASARGGANQGGSNPQTPGPQARSGSFSEYHKPVGQSPKMHEPPKQHAQILEVMSAIGRLQEEDAGIQQEMTEAKVEESVLQKRLEEVEGQRREAEERIQKGRSELQGLRSELDSKRAELIRLEDEVGLGSIELAIFRFERSLLVSISMQKPSRSANPTRLCISPL
jgi:hypothetical protein